MQKVCPTAGLLRNLRPDLCKRFGQCLQVLASPDSSYVWIQYMAFYLSLGEVSKARSIAERALQTISFRCDGSRLCEVCDTSVYKLSARVLAASRPLLAWFGIT